MNILEGREPGRERHEGAPKKWRRLLVFPVLGLLCSLAPTTPTEAAGSYSSCFDNDRHAIRWTAPDGNPEMVLPFIGKNADWEHFMLVMKTAGPAVFETETGVTKISTLTLGSNGKSEHRIASLQPTTCKEPLATPDPKVKDKKGNLSLTDFPPLSP